MHTPRAPDPGAAAAASQGGAAGHSPSACVGMSYELCPVQGSKQQSVSARPVAFLPARRSCLLVDASVVLDSSSTRPGATSGYKMPVTSSAGGTRQPPAASLPATARPSPVKPPSPRPSPPRPSPPRPPPPAPRTPPPRPPPQRCAPAWLSQLRQARVVIDATSAGACSASLRVGTLGCFVSA